MSQVLPGAETADAFCVECGRAICWFDIPGWVHRQGSGPWWQVCGNCGWEGSEATDEGCCPSCGSTRSVRDTHVAAPAGRDL